MLAHVIIVEQGGSAIPSGELGVLRAEFPSVRFHVGAGSSACPEIQIDADAFRAGDFDACRVDDRCEALGHGEFALRIVGHEVSAATVDAALTRYQRFLGRRNAASIGTLGGPSGGPAFTRVLACHRALHDCAKPLVRADFDHALDTWQWVLRLDPRAGVAVQVAALFHDVERLVSEADARIEQHASDYRAFKDEHARRGAAMTRAALAATGLDAAIIDRAADLVARHEQPGEDAERLLLNEADALSFFSLNSTGFLRYYGVEHTRRKVAYTLARLRAPARPARDIRWRLSRTQLHATVAEMLREAQTTTCAASAMNTTQRSHDERDQSSPA